MEEPLQTVLEYTVKGPFDDVTLFKRRATLTRNGNLKAGTNPIELSERLLHWLRTTCNGRLDCIIRKVDYQSCKVLSGIPILDEAVFHCDSGRVYMSFYWSGVHFRFKDVYKANLAYYGTNDKNLLHIANGRLNPFSGKFNFNFGEPISCEPEWAVRAIQCEFDKFFFRSISDGSTLLGPHVTRPPFVPRPRNGYRRQRRPEIV